MTRTVFLLGFVLIFVCLPAQRRKNLEEKAYSEADYNNDAEIYTSSESDRHDRKKQKIHLSDRLPSRKDVLNFTPDYCILSKTDNYSVYIDFVVRNTSYNDSRRKIEKPGEFPIHGKWN